MVPPKQEHPSGYSDHLIDLCLALSREKDLTQLLDLIVSKARQLTNAEAGSLYMVEGGVLSFEVLQNEPLGIHYKKQEKTAPPMPSVPLEKKGEPNLANVSSCVANTGLPIHNIDDDYQFLVRCNDACQFMNETDMARLIRIRNRTYVTRDGGACHWLTEDEFELLGIKTGNLSFEERKIIQDHALMTRKILDNIQFPKHLSKVPEFASSHHEKPNGQGYPGRLKDQDIPLQVKIMAIADIYEALTARDRPYKKPMPPSQAEAILLKMKESNEIDGELFDLCRQRGLFKNIPASNDFLAD